MAAALAKVLRGGRSGVSSRLLLPAIGRRMPHEGVAPLLPRLGPTAPLPLRGLGATTRLLPPRLGATSLSSPGGPAVGLARRLMHTTTELPRACPNELKKKYVWTGGSFQRYDSEFIPLYLLEMEGELDYELWKCRSHWKFPAVAFALLTWLLFSFLLEYYRVNKKKKAITDHAVLLYKTDEEIKALKAELLEIQKNFA